MMKVNRDGVGGNAEVHIMVRYFFIWDFFFLELGSAAGFEYVVEE